MREHRVKMRELEAINSTKLWEMASTEAPAWRQAMLKSPKLHFFTEHSLRDKKGHNWVNTLAIDYIILTL